VEKIDEEVGSEEEEDRTQQEPGNGVSNFHKGLLEGTFFKKTRLREPAYGPAAVPKAHPSDWMRFRCLLIQAPATGMWNYFDGSSSAW
jgi:hypothetical protein